MFLNIVYSLEFRRIVKRCLVSALEYNCNTLSLVDLSMPCWCVLIHPLMVCLQNWCKWAQVQIFVQHVDEQSSYLLYILAILSIMNVNLQISDFGMSRNLMDENYYISHGGKIPVKWTAPEVWTTHACKLHAYSEASQVCKDTYERDYYCAMSQFTHQVHIISNGVIENQIMCFTILWVRIIVDNDTILKYSCIRNI